MKRRLLIFGIILCIIFTSRVNALAYNLETMLVNENENSLFEIRLSINNVMDTEYGVAACEFNLNFSDFVKLNESVRTVNNWSMLKGEIYVF